MLQASPPYPSFSKKRPTHLLFQTQAQILVYPEPFIQHGGTPYTAPCPLPLLSHDDFFSRTWSGPLWSPAQNLGSLLLSIQSILNEKPFFNEPGFTTVGKILFSIKMYMCVCEQ